MPDSKIAPAEKPTPSNPNADVFRIVLRLPDRESAGRVFRKRPLDVGPIQVRPDTKELDATVYATRAQMAELKAEGLSFEVYENLSEVGRKRQKEVGKGDRFEGGKIAPKGLGRKTAKEKE